MIPHDYVAFLIRNIVEGESEFKQLLKFLITIGCTYNFHVRQKMSLMACASLYRYAAHTTNSASQVPINAWLGTYLSACVAQGRAGWDAHS